MRLATQLSDKSLLIVLDNFEQLLDGAPLVADMLRASPRTKVLVTSRAPLRISGEQEMPVPPLGVSLVDAGADLDKLMESEAIRLFTDRAMAVRPDFRLTADNGQVVAELVGRLDGLPLAIELVASRLRLLPVDQILSRLGARMLSSGSVDLPERQRTIESAIGWSHELLGEPERKLFAAIRCFRSRSKARRGRNSLRAPGRTWSGSHRFPLGVGRPEPHPEGRRRRPASIPDAACHP